MKSIQLHNFLIALIFSATTACSNGQDLNKSSEPLLELEMNSDAECAENCETPTPQNSPKISVRKPSTPEPEPEIEETEEPYDYEVPTVVGEDLPTAPVVTPNPTEVPTPNPTSTPTAKPQTVVTPAPPSCGTLGTTRCSGFTKQVCSSSGWTNSQYNATSCGYVAPVTCSGKKVGDSCYYLAPTGASCASVCSSRGGVGKYNVSDYSCRAMLSSLGQSVGGGGGGTPGLGCYATFANGAGWLWGSSSYDPNATHPSAKRVCACAK